MATKKTQTDAEPTGFDEDATIYARKLVERVSADPDARAAVFRDAGEPVDWKARCEAAEAILDHLSVDGSELGDITPLASKWLALRSKP